MQLSDVHTGLTLPESCSQCDLVKGKYHYYHYGCDGQNDAVSLDSELNCFIMSSISSFGSHFESVCVCGGGGGEGAEQKSYALVIYHSAFQSL